MGIPSSLKVLLIAESRHSAKGMVQLLSALPRVRLEQAERLADAFLILAHLPVDIVLLDVGEPACAGVEQFVELRQKAPHLPIVVLMGHNDEACGLRLIRLGAQDYWVKPELTSLELGRRLRVTVERHRSQAAERSQEKRQPLENPLGAAGEARAEQTRVEPAIAYSEERYRSIFQIVPVAIWEEDWSAVIAMIRELRQKGVTDFTRYFADHPEFVFQALDQIKVLDVNDAALKLMKADSKADLLQSLRIVFSTPDVLPGFVQELVALAKGEQVFMAEMPCRTVSNDLIHVLLTMLFPPPESQSGTVLVSAMDITERKQTEDRLRESEERFKYVARVTTDAIWDWDLRTDQVWWNEGLESLFGYSPEEVEPASRSWTNHIHPDDQDRVLANIHQTIAQGESWEQEYRFIRKDGSVADVLDRGFVIRDGSGKAVRMVGGMTDLTERKLYERRLQEQAALLDKARDAIVVQDLNHRITFWNKGAERIYGWRAEEVIGRNVMSLIYDDPASFFQASRHVLDFGKWNGELAQRNRDGERILVQARWTLVRDETGAPTGILAINTDITEHKQLEERLLRAQRLESIGVLAGGIAHDLNNVLAPILLSTFLLKQIVQTEQGRQQVEIIEKSAQRGAQMVRQVLTFARGGDETRTHAEVGEIIREVALFMRETVDRRIQIETEIVDGVWPVEGNPTQLHQVFVNLCVNARDAMPAGGRLRITVENLQLDKQSASVESEAHPGPYVRVTVADTGAGIPLSIRHRIFDPFFTTKEVGRGTGLGLPTALGIVRSHGGFINVYSEEGKGSVFSVYLSAKPVELACAQQSGFAQLPYGNGELVLVVDDESAVRTLTRQTLEAFGYQVLLAEDGPAALSLYAQHRNEIAVVFTDMMMPGMDGAATIRSILEINPTVKIIATSGLAASGMGARAAEAGVEYFLPKPYTADAMLSMLAKVLGK